MRCVDLSKKRWQKVLQSEQAEVQNHRGVGDDNHAIRAERIETRSCSTISGVKEGIRRRNNSSSNAKRSRPAMPVATDLETRPLENKATASSSFSSDSLKEANAGSSGSVRITGGRESSLSLRQGKKVVLGEFRWKFLQGKLNPVAMSACACSARAVRWRSVS